MNLLVVEDDPRVSDFLARCLRAEGYLVTVAADGPAGLALGRAGNHDLLLLDLILPGLSGLEVCQRLRAAGSSLPILMLTARDAAEDKIRGLRLGADDYLTKPFDIDELLARIDALLRRSHSPAVVTKTLVVGELVFDRQSMSVRRGNRPIDLTAKELALLELLMSAPGRVFSRERILNMVWGYAEDPLTNVVDVYISRLRKKIDPESEGATCIQTLRGLGYKLVTPGTDQYGANT